MLDKIKDLLSSSDQLEKRVSSIESRLDTLESDVARQSDVELVRKELESLESEGGGVSKSRLVRSRVLELVDRGMEKGEVKEKVVSSESLCSESYFYENWNYLLDAGFIVCDDSDGSVKSVVESLPDKK